MPPNSEEYITLVKRIYLHSDDDIKNIDEDFILFIGTSHTVGECERSDSEYLDNDDVWVHKLAQKYNLNYVKLAYGGTENTEILMMLSSFIKLCQNFSSRCKLIIGEVRLGSFLPYISRETLNPNPKSFNMFDMGQWLDNSKSWEASNQGEGFEKKQPYLISNNFHVWGYEQIEKITNKEFHYGGPHSGENKKSLESYLEVYINSFGSAMAWQKCMYDVIHMSYYASSHNIPFRWFTLNENWQFFSDDRAETKIFWRNKIMNALKKEYSDVWAENLEKDEKKTLIYIMEDMLGETSCECGHLDEKFQDALASRLFNKLTESGIKI